MFKEFLELQLFKFGSYEIRVYSLVLAVLWYILAKIFLTIIKRWLHSKVKKSEMDIGSEFAVMQIARYVIWTTFWILILETFHISVSFLLAGSAALLVGIGLGLQQVFHDFISGFILLLEGGIKVNDVLEFDGSLGRIVKIGIRTSEMQTFQDTVVIVPNSKLISNRVINWSHTDHTARYDVKVLISYQNDEILARDLLIQAALSHEWVLKKPSPFVRLTNFDTNGIELQILFWSKQIMFSENIKSDIRFKIRSLFNENQIEIPISQTEIKIKKGD